MATTPSTLDKALVSHATLRDQGSVGLFFEYTALYSLNGDDKADVQVQNLALFAVGAHLFTKRNVANVLITPEGSTLRTHKTQASFRNKTVEEITAENAFLTVLHAWEFATHRASVSAMEAKSRDGKVHHLATATHALVNEPFMVPVNKADTSDIVAGDATVARRIARQAETLWLSLAPKEYTPWSDSTPAHRVPGAARSQFELESGSLMSNLVSAVAAPNVETLPAFTPLSTIASSKLSDHFRETAQNRLTWE